MSDEPPSAGPSTGRARLRQAAAAARPMGADANIHSIDSREGVHGLPPGCPVVPLGVSGAVRFYLDAKRQLQSLAAKDHNRLHLLGLFHNSSEFLYQHKPWRRSNAEGATVDWRPGTVAEDFMRACGLAGIWDAAERERGRGAWLGDAGELILHAGDQIHVFEPAAPDAWAGRISRPPGVIGRYVYPAGERAGTPADIEAAADDPGGALLDILETWAWRRGDLDAVLMLGWIGAAMIGGALSWRSVAWITGGRGTGKSTLQALLKAVFGGLLLDLADATPAYIWQTLGRQSLPVAVDELEATDDNRKVLDVVRLARIAASGGQLGRGSDKHIPVKFTLRSSFLFSSILIPPLNAADRSRIAILDLQELPPHAETPNLDPTTLRAIGAQLRRRMIDGWPRFRRTLDRYRRALEAVGHNPRAADQFGNLLTCADLLLFRGDTDEGAAADWIARMNAADLSETNDDVRDEIQCLNHMLSAPLDATRGGERASVGEWINRAAGRVPDYDKQRDAVRLLQTVGLRIEIRNRERYIAIANNHSGLAALFEKTRWTTPRGTMGVWTQAMRRLPGAERVDTPLYFAGPISKTTMIPLTLIPQDDARPMLDLGPPPAPSHPASS